MTVRGLPTTASELFPTVNQFLTTIVEVHDAIFRFQVRNLFRAMDFERYHSLLESVTNAIEELEVGLSLKPDRWKSEVGEPGFALVLSYLGRLKEASAKLRDIAGNLELKGKGQPYPHRQYRADLTDYQRSEDAYVALGDDMNSLFRRIG
jgi:hypothetical protein